MSGPCGRSLGEPCARLVSRQRMESGVLFVAMFSHCSVTVPIYRRVVLKTATDSPQLGPVYPLNPTHSRQGPTPARAPPLREYHTSLRRAVCGFVIFQSDQGPITAYLDTVTDILNNAWRYWQLSTCVHAGHLTMALESPVSSPLVPRVTRLLLATLEHSIGSS